MKHGEHSNARIVKARDAVINTITASAAYFARVTLLTNIELETPECTAAERDTGAGAGKMKQEEGEERILEEKNIHTSLCDSEMDIYKGTEKRETRAGR